MTAKGRKKISDKKVYIFEEFRTTGKSGNGKLCAFESENCDCCGGVLASGFGGKTMKDLNNNTVVIPDDGSDMKMLQYLKIKSGNGDIKLLLLTQKNNNFYYYDDDIGDFVFIRTFNEQTKLGMFDATDSSGNFSKMVFGSEGVFKYSQTTNKLNLTSNEKMAVGCFCNTRAFYGTSGNKIIFSKTANATESPTLLDESGYFIYYTDKGSPMNMCPYKNFVYIFLERGIARLKTAGRGRDFEIEEIPFNEEKIFSNSQIEINGKIYFLTEGGVYVLDGEKAVKAYEEMRIFPDYEEKVSAAVCENRYILRYVDKYKGQRTVVLETDGEHGYEAFDMVNLCGFEGEGFYQQNKVVKLLTKDGTLPSGNEYRFLSERLTFNSNEDKTLRSLCFEGNGVFRLVIHSERKRREITVDLSDGWTRVRPFVKGKEFSFEFFLEGGASITKMSVETERLKGGWKNGN